MKRFLSSLVTLSALVLAIPALHATPITGQFSVTGASVQDTGTSLIFDPATINVGAANTLTGSFATLLTAGESGVITSPINYASYVPGSASLVFGTGSNQLTFTINSIDSLSVSNFGLFTGNGIISTSAAGYDPTLATLYFSTQANGTVTFSATAISAGKESPAPTPEPSTLLMLGTGLVSAAGVLKRRLS